MTTSFKPEDEVILIGAQARRRGPFRVARVENELVWVRKRRVNGKPQLEPFYPRQLSKLQPGQSVREALLAAVPPDQRCEICELNPAPERHFVTVPFPKGFTRVCGEDLAQIKAEIRKRVKDTVVEVFAEAKARQLKELLKE